ncbi:hypothetical protein FEM48_Zijuj01G0038100 [Ziziphus jujuba var. spinosa]|uniref:Nudix hydrolase domain-containing protein n=1 Tax=Ziziphus jujuba var. spinosa TaxID=714518 RepID=A0A978VYZ5_ZIZJJ|nr:hypothetical protein FEM48_Zijuj01G0038100 [Ziziphus jujuba var. spinosa]
MISLLRRLAISLPSTAPPPLFKLMDSASSFGGSQRLMALAHQLRFYKPPPSPLDDDFDDLGLEDSGGKVVSQVGFVESATPVAQDPERFRPKKAAVLVCLFEGDAGDLRVILTKRSSRLNTHSGEIALPGGKADEGDKDDGDTATREAKEEIGLDPSLVNIVTVLEPFLSKPFVIVSLFGFSHDLYMSVHGCAQGNISKTSQARFKAHHLLRVVPVIGILTDKKAFKPAPNPAEVEAVFDAPLEMFIKDENRRAEEREWLGNQYLIHFFDYKSENKKYVIWGLTAGILIRAASIVYQRPPPFLEQNPIFKVPRILEKDTVLP